MGKDWPPPRSGKIVPIRPVGDWTKAAAYGGAGAARSRQALAVLAAAMLLGVGAGAALHWSEAPRTAAPAEWVPPQPEVLIPEAEADSADAEWEGRGNAGRAAGLPRSSTARNDGVRVAFGYCHSGGGTNCVVDGDTFFIGGAKVRIAGIDAPQTHDYRCASELALGDRATAQLQALLNSGAVTMSGIDRNRDSYGRLLRNVAVDGQDVGEAMIAAGVAREYGRGRLRWC